MFYQGLRFDDAGALRVFGRIEPNSKSGVIVAGSRSWKERTFKKMRKRKKPPKVRAPKYPKEAVSE